MSRVAPEAVIQLTRLSAEILSVNELTSLFAVCRSISPLVHVSETRGRPSRWHYRGRTSRTLSLTRPAIEIDPGTLRQIGTILQFAYHPR